MTSTKCQFITTILFALIFSHIFFTADAQVLRKRTTTLMGSRFDISIVADDTLSAEANIDTVIAEITRIENLISDWKETSQVSAINRNAGIQPVKVDSELFELTKRAIRLSEMTNGTFDISFGSMEKVWKYDGSMTEIPSAEIVKRSVAKVGYKNIILDSLNSTIFLKLEGMKIGFGSIGKGYAADRGRNVMRARGIDAGIVNASGDMSTWGTQPNGKDWKIGITDPRDTRKLLGTITIKEASVVTSGNYEKYIEIGGKRFSHIINPLTGYPATGLSSVTVIGPEAEIANGFSTALIVLGERAGLEIIKKFPDYQCIIVSDKGRITTSDRLNKRNFRLK
ncbi:thiamine biosynthesis lipoprotein [Dyadobacter koreensis]|uniref:FAD:protein FMN transferase n=1 Tax=Dyadobacter koreensis TaxID=408657 RepID=A0A1H6QP75_9BACT|nr:FAD:protein FMN transferase [Dyadobacter koreensis]SEI45429.1 thiamine biosynthesis lipoprotein [Dyadobacter koreensis]